MKSLSRRMRGWGRAWHLYFSHPVAKLLGASWWRTVQWCRGMRFRLFLQGLPALLAGVGLVVLTAFSLMSPIYEVEARYLEQGRAAFQAKDYPLALTCFERVCAQGGERPEVLYEMALTAEVLGQQDRAVLLMRQLAPADRQGYGDAHLWWAIRLLQQTPQTKAQRDEAQAHLLRALQGQVNNREFAHGMLGDLYLIDDKLDQAEVHLSKAIKVLPNLRIRLAIVYERLGNSTRARREAQEAADFYQKRSQANPSEHHCRLRWAEAVTFLKQYPEAVAILEAGWANTREPAYRVALGVVYADWWDYRIRVQADKASDQLGLVEKGLSHDPTNLALLNRLLAVVAAGGKEAEKARGALRGLLARGEATGLAHFGLGVDAMQQGDQQQARLHWEQALQLAPHMVHIANNLAMLLIQDNIPLPVLGANTVALAGSPQNSRLVLGALACFPETTKDTSDLARALKLIHLALDKAPDDANFRDTRGRIYLKMGRWKEALPDLEAALVKFPNSADLHRRLATVYSRLGVQAMAEEHQRLADQLATAGRKKAKG